MPSLDHGMTAIRHADQVATMHAQDCRESGLAALRQQLTHLLTHFKNDDIASELQRLHNALPEEQRDGYRMEIAMLSKDYQMGAYDDSL